MDACIARMVLELDTAGNIRLEEGRPSDLWYSSCVELLHSRFNGTGADYEGLGVTGLTVTSVARCGGTRRIAEGGGKVGDIFCWLELH